MDRDWLQQRLTELIRSTPGEQVTAGFWVGDKAAEQRVNDNLRSGRLYWQQAREGAKRALQALERGELEYAELAWRNAESLRAAAIETRLKPSEFAFLMEDAGKRGRGSDPDVEDRDIRLADAVSAQEAGGLKGAQAVREAIRYDSRLSAEFRNMSAPGITKALARGRASKLKTE